MNIDSSNWIRMIVSGFIIAGIIVILKLIFGLIPDFVPVLACIIVPLMIIEVNNITDVFIKGTLTGIFAGLALSILYITLVVFIFVIFIVFCIISLLISYLCKGTLKIF